MSANRRLFTGHDNAEKRKIPKQPSMFGEKDQTGESEERQLSVREKAVLRCAIRRNALFRTLLSVVVALVAFCGSLLLFNPREPSTRIFIAMVTGVPLACAAASCLELATGLSFPQLEERWKHCRSRRLLTALLIALALIAPLVAFALIAWLA